MTEVQLENTIISILRDKDIINDPLKKESAQSYSPFLQGDVFKAGTRIDFGNEDILIEVLSIDDEQFQNAIVSVRTYIDDINIGSPKPVPNLSRIEEVFSKFEDVFKTKNSSYAITTSDYRMKINSIKRERREGTNQHCVNCLFNLVIRNF